MAEKVSTERQIWGYLHLDEVEVVRKLARERKWSLSQTVSELVRKSPDFRRRSAKPARS